MTYLLSEEQSMLRDSARDFLQGQAPVALQRSLRDSDAGLGFEPAVWQQAIDLGWLCAVFPEEQGGLAMGYQGMGCVFEHMGRNLAALPLLSQAVLCGELLLRTANAAQQALWLPALLAGTQRFALALEEGGRHAPLPVHTRARRVDGAWVLDGEKWFVMDGVGAQQLIVTACLEDGSLGLFVVDVQSPGVALQRSRMVDSRNSARVQLQAVRLGDDRQLAAHSHTAQALDAVLDRARICLAAEALGLTREAFERTVAYLKERVQFDVPIGSFQALQHRVARLYTELELLESCVRAALAAIDADAPDLPLLASLAKARASDLCERVLNEAVQLHGGIGVTDEFDLGLFVKRARVLQHTLGDGIFHRDRYALLRDF
ncbi:acyl-CoA dehydrogenase [Rhodoferax lacus]|uniref:Acyl-CoA dehydrogenase n=1 Tax=Rhodoferax lacus TaxID=2184758 RepID=A0A3E1R9F8_9BURK|nr:acyl-CoA dehydrogenase family protein [Rhodoferax lacus]RFO96008.1 acyl-CoA dehydrogenase [Rhodoferax lacus]